MKTKQERELAKEAKELINAVEKVMKRLQKIKDPEEQFINELEKIAEWNKKTFPDATLSGQLEKLEEEFQEYVEAPTPEEELKELADVCIVCGGLQRWNSVIGRMVIANMIRIKNKSLPELNNAIRAKMEVNKKRKWHKSGEGKFHH